MPAAPGSDGPPARRSGLALLSRFALIGVGATLLYAVLALLMSDALPPVPASLAAYAVATAFSYLGHKFVTFVSEGAHRTEMPRFLVLTLAGFGIATALPAVLTSMLGWPPAIAVLLTCVLVPAVNFFVLDRWVFARRAAG